MRSRARSPGRPERAAQAKPADDAPHGPGVLRLLPADAVSDKEITLGGRKIAYTATAGTLSLFDQSGEKSAAVFYTAYVAKDADAARRPLTFVFNGGPGAASAYLNLGLAGPRIVDFGPDGRDGAAAKLVDNPDSWLAFTDLVMIDPIGTGWSRTAKPDDAKASTACAATPIFFAKVIALYVAKNSRSASPKYLLGESYGGFRAAKVARALQQRPGHRRHRHRHGVAAARSVVPVGQLAISRSAPRCNSRRWSATELERTKKFTPEALAEAERFAMNEYLTDARRPAADRRQGQGVLRPHRRDDRLAGRCRGQVARLCPQRLPAASARRRPDRQQL